MDEATPPPPEPVKSTEERFWEFFARVNPHLVLPRHFTVYVRRVLCAIGGDLRLVFAAPPQHGKTEVTLALIAFLVLEHPGKRWAYITYNQQRANTISRKFRRLMASAGHVSGGTLAVTYLPGGGQILFTSIDGGITGEPVDGAAFIDDPYKGRKEADSEQRRKVVDDTYREAIETRVHPGASLFLLATRWHPQDLSGTLTSRDLDEPFEYINLQAIAEGATNDNDVVADDPNGRKVGEALFPEKWPVEALAKKRAKILEFAWESLYQGRPRPKGGKVFRGVHYYRELPQLYTGGYGIDLAYSVKKSADDSSCVELWREDTPSGPRFYVVQVDTKHIEAPAFAVTLRARHVKRPSFPMFWRYSGTEKGSADFLIEKGLPIERKPIPGDKLVCAQHVAPAWNGLTLADGSPDPNNPPCIFVPDPEVFDCEEWLYPFLDCLHNFTGGGKEKDDPVDAFGNIFDELRGESDAGGLATAGGRKQH